MEPLHDRPSLRGLYKDIIALESVSPGPHVNAVMSQLVEWVVTHDDSDELTDKEHQQVRSISAAAESAMEYHWAKRIIDAVDPIEEMTRFPYLENYEELTRREVSLLRATDNMIDHQSTVLFIGSGPLPLSAFQLSLQEDIAVTQLDSDAAALETARELASKVGIKATFIHADATTMEVSEQFDIIIVAALAGSTKEDKQIIVQRAIRALAPGGRLVIRSAHGARQLLYSAIDPRSFEGVTLFSEYHPNDDVVNSVLIYKVDVSMTNR